MYEIFLVNFWVMCQCQCQGHREFPFGNSREFPGIAEPKIPGGNSREFLKFWRELRGIYRSFVFFPIFIVDYDILLFNLTYCIMCTTHDGLLYRFLSKTLNDVFDPTFCVLVPVYFQTLISKITEQRQNLNEDAEINNSNRSLAKVLHSSAWDGMCSKEGVLRGGSVRVTSVRTGGGRFLIQR